jgi:transcriptional antiterminator RfaH
VSAEQKIRHWYLVQCKPRESFRAEIHLNNQGIECFHPTCYTKSKNKSLAPLFPYYLFVTVPRDVSLAPVRSTRGVSRIVSFNGMPATVSESLIDNLKFYCEKLKASKPVCAFKSGARVRINEGCFEGLEAIVMTANKLERVTLLLDFFSQQHKVEFPVYALEACG